MSFILYIKPLNNNAFNYYEEKINNDTQHDGDSGIDLVINENIEILPHETKLVKLGIQAEMIEYNNIINIFNIFIYFILIILFIFINIYIYIFIWLIYILYLKKSNKNVSWFLYPRSSISKTPLILHNSIGLIDRDYRGELMAPLHNISDKAYIINKGVKLVQAVAPDIKKPIKFVLTNDLSNTIRGENGLGSTGK